MALQCSGGIDSSQAPQKRANASGGKGTPAKLPRIQPAGSSPGTSNQIKLAREPQSQAPATVSTPPTKKLTVNKVSLVKTKRIHKRIQADEHQTEALDSGDEFEPGFKVASDKKSVSHNGTQVDEHDLTPGRFWVCQRMKIKQEIKQEMGEDGVTVKQEPLNIKHEPGMNGNHGYHHEPFTSHESPSRASPNSFQRRTNSKVMVKEIKQEHEEKQQDLTKKFAAAQQEIGDSVNKWEDSEKKARDLIQQLTQAHNQAQDVSQQLKQAHNQAQDFSQQLAQAHNHGKVQDTLENLRVNVFNLLRTLIDQDDVNLDNYVDDSRSAQVDDIVQRVLDDNQ